LGSNGKSTFVKLAAGRLAPMSGRIMRGMGLEVGYFAQHPTGCGSQPTEQ
jgi:ATP-binding cassette subfamily F protein 3